MQGGWCVTACARHGCSSPVAGPSIRSSCCVPFRRTRSVSPALSIYVDALLQTQTRQKKTRTQLTIFPRQTGDGDGVCATATPRAPESWHFLRCDSGGIGIPYRTAVRKLESRRGNGRTGIRCAGATLQADSRPSMLRAVYWRYETLAVRRLHGLTSRWHGGQRGDAQVRVRAVGGKCSRGRRVALPATVGDPAKMAVTATASRAGRHPASRSTRTQRTHSSYHQHTSSQGPPCSTETSF